MIFGVVNGKPALPSVSAMGTRFFSEWYQAGVVMNVSSNEICRISTADRKWQALEPAHDNPEESSIKVGDVITVGLELESGRADGSVEWHLNDTLLKRITGLKPSSYQMIVELHKRTYEPEAMAVTLVSYVQQ